MADNYGIGSAVGGLINGIVNWFSTKKTNETNKEINENNLDFQAAQTREAWERDDNAHQREVADLEAAGLSPLASTNGNQVSAPLSAPSPIAMQAPQIDANTIINSVLRSQELQEQIRHNKEQENAKEIELTQTASEIVIKAEQVNLGYDELNQQIKYQSDLIKQMADELAETEKHNRNEEALKKLSWLSEQHAREIKEQTGGKDIPTRDIYDYQIFLKSKQLWDLQYKNFLDTLPTSSEAKGSGKSKGGSAGLSVGATALGTGINANGNGSYNTSEQNYESKNQEQKIQEMINQWYMEHPMPVYHIYRPEGR